MEWIVELNPDLCHFGAIEEEPSPRYDADRDRLVCHRKATIGQRVSWSLGNPIETGFPTDSIDRYRWFGKFFLDGLVCPRLEQFRPALLCSSNAMVKSWASLMERTQFLLNALAAKQLDSRARLTQTWSTQPKCNLVLRSFRLHSFPYRSARCLLPMVTGILTRSSQICVATDAVCCLRRLAESSREKITRSFASMCCKFAR